jgi:hypothetical protein
MLSMRRSLLHVTAPLAAIALLMSACSSGPSQPATPTVPPANRTAIALGGSPIPQLNGTAIVPGAEAIGEPGVTGTSLVPTEEPTEVPPTEVPTPTPVPTPQNQPVEPAAPTLGIVNTPVPFSSYSAQASPASSFSTYQVNSVVTQITLNMGAQNDSGVAGFVAMTEIGGTRVDIRLVGPDGLYPALIMEGSCTAPTDTVLQRLGNVQGGSRTVEIDHKLMEMVDGYYALVVQQSPDDNTMISCGNIVR